MFTFRIDLWFLLCYLLLFSPATRYHGQFRFSQKTRNSVTGNLSAHSFKCPVLTITSMDLANIE